MQEGPFAPSSLNLDREKRLNYENHFYDEKLNLTSQSVAYAYYL